MDFGTITWIAGYSVILISSFIALYSYTSNKKCSYQNLIGKHVLVTGGSKGIGKHIAIEAVKIGANVSILARSTTGLEEARNEILQYVIFPNDQRIICIPVDLSDNFEAVKQVIDKAEEELGPVSILVNNAGYCKAAKFEDTSISCFKDMMEVNYMGAVKATQCVIKTMKNRREGKILFVSSDAGLCGVYGFTSYSATKFALRGLAEALAMELKPYNVSVTVSCPPDTDTPGFAEENKDKPEETRLISEAAGLYSAESVANTSLFDTLNGKFISTMGIDGHLQATLCVGMSPFTSWMDLIIQVLDRYTRTWSNFRVECSF